MTKHVEFKTVAAGPDLNAQPGDRKHVSDEMAADLIAGGHAELVADAAAREEVQGEARAAARGKATSRAAAGRSKR
jgi:hypothetical protein